MVKIEEVADEDLLNPQVGPQGGDEDWDDTDTESDTSSLADAPLHESLYERLTALKDIIPPSSRNKIASGLHTTYETLTSGLLWSGKALWVVSSSALLLGVPWALAYAEEQQLVEMEREMKMQQSANDLITPGASTQQSGQARPAL